VRIGWGYSNVMEGTATNYNNCLHNARGLCLQTLRTCILSKSLADDNIHGRHSLGDSGVCTRISAICFYRYRRDASRESRCGRCWLLVRSYPEIFYQLQLKDENDIKYHVKSIDNRRKEGGRERERKRECTFFRIFYFHCCDIG
jgi:hypothetical protein